MIGREQDIYLALLLGSLLLLATAAALALVGGIPSAPLEFRPSVPLPVDSSRSDVASSVFVKLPAVAGALLLCFSLTKLLRACTRGEDAYPRGPRVCRRCGHEQSGKPFAACEKCGAPAGCPQCGLDLTRTTTDLCHECGLAWGCPRCGYSYKGLTSNPCPFCGAHSHCGRCGHDLLHNIDGRCPKCSAPIAGWRDWRRMYHWPRANSGA